MVQNKVTSVVCGTTLAGRHSNNLIVRLRRIHEVANKIYLSKAKNKTEAKRGMKRTIDGTPGGLLLKAQTLSECIQRCIISWPLESNEHQQRQKLQMKLFQNKNLN